MSKIDETCFQLSFDFCFSPFPALDCLGDLCMDMCTEISTLALESVTRVKCAQKGKERAKSHSRIARL